MKSILLTLLIICSSTSLWAQSLDTIQLSDDVVGRLGLKSTVITKNIISNPVSATAKLIIDPTRTHAVASFFSGQITSQHPVLGQEVKQDDLLLTLKSREIATIVSEYIKASSKLKTANLIYEREESLRAKKLTTGDAFLSAKVNYEEAVASHAAALQTALMAKTRAELQALNTLAEDDAGKNFLLEIVSPISGVIIEKHVTTGAAVEENQLLYKIADLSKLLVAIKVPLQAVDKIKLGDEVTFKTVIGNQIIGSAVVSKISPEIDSQSLTLRVFALLDNPKRSWIAGTPVVVDIIDSAEKPKLSVPSSAIVNIGGKDCVFVDEGGGNYQPIEIVIGQRSQSFVEITGETKSDLKVVDKGASLLLAAWEERASN